MKMAKASENDLNAALEMCRALDALEDGSLPDEMTEGDDVVFYDAKEHAEKVVEHLVSIFKKASMFRVCFGMTVVLDPQNEIFDPSDDCLALNPRLVSCAKVCEGIPDETLKSWLKPPEGQLGAPHGTWAKQLAEVGRQAILMQQQSDELLAAGRALVERWDTPLWKNVPATAEYIGALRTAIAKSEAA